MASVNLKKYGTNTAVYGIPRHNYRDGHNHSNPDINPSLTPYNRHYGPQTSAEYKERFKSMVKDADERKPPKRKKKDRKTYLGLSIPSPREGMSPEDELRWSEVAYKAIEEMFPGQVVGGTYHADEVHPYIDPHDNQEHMSRGHTHIGIIPWTDQYGLNMDKFYRRDLPNKINAKLDEKCMELFGIPFRDGSQKKSRGTVEQMKLESTKKELRQREDAIKEMDDIVDMNNQIITQQDRQIASQSNAIESKNALLNALEGKIRRKQYIVDNLTENVQKSLNEAFRGLVEPMLTKLDNCRKAINKPWMSQEQQAYAGELLDDAAATIQKKIPEWGNDMLQNRADKVEDEVGKATEYFKSMRAAEQGNGNIDDMDYLVL